MKNQTKALYINKFLRAFPEVFTLKEFINYMSYVGCEISKDEAVEILEGSPYLLKVAKGKYQTRSGAFTGKYFSFAITKEECEAKCFVPAQRCMPFVDQDVFSFSLLFSWEEKILPQKTVKFSKDFALEHFLLYGEEYEAQYISSYPGMKDFVLSDNEFELPMEVSLYSVDLSSLFKVYDIKTGDRFLLKVIDWDEGIIDIKPLLRSKSSTLELTEEDLQRNLWYKKFEKYLLESFRKFGPCASIEEQLVNVFSGHIEELTGWNSGSVEEFLKKTKKVSVELFGVETRLWYKGESVPAIGSWNGDEEDDEKSGVHNLLYSIPDYVLDEYLKDFAYQKETDLQKLIADIFPKSFYISPEYHKELLLHIANRNGIILKKYNWFADHQLGEIRHKALKLYTKISTLVYEIDRAGGKFNNYPQQELVILIQLYTHLTKLIESISFDSDYVTRDMDTIDASLEGMEFNFEDIESELRDALFACKKRDFIVID